MGLYMYQIIFLKKVHADPHPGNFYEHQKTNLVALDFGCMNKFLDFSIPIFELIDKMSSMTRN
jgi:predicted unusual protein kinase regulating ubiquinone biosynthesis (AarF/ABC1/UbiB family)